MKATINHLPPEMVIHLLQHLSLSELIEKKRVCKLWNEVISTHLKTTRLVVDSDPRKKDPWWLLRQQVDEYFEVCHPNLFISQHRNPILTNLKCLRIRVFDPLEDFDLNDLNAFAQLVQLEVDYTFTYPINRIEWNLPNIEVLVFRSWGRAEAKCVRLSIDCKKLKALFYDESENDLIEVKTPETITILEGNFYGSKLAKFKGLEIYKCRTHLNHVNDVLIRQLPNLKVLEICKDLQELYLGEAEEVKEFLKELLDLRRKELRSDLRLFFAGVEIRDELFVDRLDLQFSARHQLSKEHFYFGDYPEDDKPNLQGELVFVEEAHYNRLMGLVHEIPRDYFKRFYGIRKLYATGPVQDPDHFAFYIKQLPYLKSLILHYPELKQAWYDRLPNICCLEEFSLCDKSEIELSFDFLGFFEPYIQSFRLERKLSLRSARSLPNLTKSFPFWYERRFEFKFRGADAVIRLNDSVLNYVELGDKYDVLINHKLKLERANSMEVVDYFEGLERELVDA